MHEQLAEGPLARGAGEHCTARPFPRPRMDRWQTINGRTLFAYTIYKFQRGPSRPPRRPHLRTSTRTPVLVSSLGHRIPTHLYPPARQLSTSPSCPRTSTLNDDDAAASINLSSRIHITPTDHRATHFVSKTQPMSPHYMCCKTLMINSQTRLNYLP